MVSAKPLASLTAQACKKSDQRDILFESKSYNLHTELRLMNEGNTLRKVSVESRPVMRLPAELQLARRLAGVLLKKRPGSQLSRVTVPQKKDSGADSVVKWRPLLLARVSSPRYVCVIRWEMVLLTQHRLHRQRARSRKRSCNGAGRHCIRDLAFDFLDLEG